MASSAIRKTLGFNPQTLASGYHEGENPVNILTNNTILVNCDIISGSFFSGNQQPVVYSFFPDGSPGYKIIDSPNNLVYLPISQTGNISRMRVWLTGQYGMQLNLRGEVISTRLHIRSI